MTNTNETYIASKVFRLCIQPRTFDYISKSVDGLDPVELSRILYELQSSNQMIKKDDLWSIVESEKAPSLNLHLPDPHLYLKKYMGYFDFLKTPHPLDFEWRNSSASLNYLINHIQEINHIKDKILVLGMPTLFATACLKDIPQHVTLVERNKPIIRGLSRLLDDTNNRFNIIEKDIFQAQPNEIGSYYSVIMDPPWYTPHFYQFMWLAAQCVELGGIVGISLPPINTRPGIIDERIDWFSFCQKQGLCIESLSPQKLRYTMPFFEFNAFRSAGISDIPPFWRKGDFALFRKVKNSSSQRPPLDTTPLLWEEREIDHVRFRVKKQNSNTEGVPFTIESIIKGDILPTVSTRDERRNQANLWTSGNRVFKVSNPTLFLSLIDNINNGSKEHATEITVVKDFVRMITDFEQKEYNDYLDWLYHEMEREIT